MQRLHRCLFYRNCLFDTDKRAHKRKVRIRPRSQEPLVLWCEVQPTKSQLTLTCQTAESLPLCPDAEYVEHSGICSCLCGTHVSHLSLFLDEFRARTNRCRWALMLGWKRDIHSFMEVTETAAIYAFPSLEKSLTLTCKSKSNRL